MPGWYGTLTGQPPASSRPLTASSLPGVLMGDLLSNATSGLLAFQRAIDTTGHNIANVNTEGFSRQRVQIGTRNPEPASNGWLGNGADVKTVERLYDALLASQSRSTAGELQRVSVYGNNAEALNRLFGDAQSGVNASLRNFVDSFQDLATSPSSIPARQVVLSQAQVFRDRLTSYDERLATIDRGIETQLADEMRVISTLAQQIATLNQRIEIEQARTQQPPNDLLDQRDLLLDRLATHVNVQVTTQDNGSVLVSVGNGQPLVIGSNAATLTTIPDPFDPLRTGIAIQGLGVPVDITSRLTGGTLGGLADFRREILTPARNALGRLGIAVAEVVNTQHRNGIDLNGDFGGDLLAVGGVEVLDHRLNAGSGVIAATRTSAGALTDADYVLELTGSGWALRNAETGAAVTLAGAGTLASPFTADGLSLVVSGAAAVGDSFLVRPTRNAIAGFNVLIDEPTELAAAAPITAALNAANTGTGRITAGEVLLVTNPALQTPVTLQFNSATTYQVNGVGPSIAYTSGANIDINGWRVAISGAPVTGDSFSIGPNNNPIGDNRNALRLTAALTQPVLDNGVTTLHAGAGRLVSTVGVATAQARTQREAQQVLFDNSLSARDSISGVNLDEEAANLIRLQQAYQAAAQAISVAGTLFQSVLDAVRR